MAPTALAALVVLGPLVGRWTAERPRWAWSLTGLALVPVAVLTLVPVDRAVVSGCQVGWSVPTPTRVELFADLVLFVAPARAAVVATRPPGVVLLAGAGLSLVIEVLQLAVAGIGRSCDTSDWLGTTLGAAVGVALGGPPSGSLDEAAASGRGPPLDDEPGRRRVEVGGRPRSARRGR